MTNINSLLRRKRVGDASFADRLLVSKKIIDHILGLGRPFVLSHSLGRGSSVVYDLISRTGTKFSSFVVLTRFTTAEVAGVLARAVIEVPDLRVVSNGGHIQKGLNTLNRNRCYQYLKVLPAGSFINESRAGIWFTGTRHGRGPVFRKILEVEDVETKLMRVNPILNWDEWDVARYIEDYDVNLIEGFKSVDCSCCATDMQGVLRWTDSVKQCGGCGRNGGRQASQKSI